MLIGCFLLTSLHGVAHATVISTQQYLSAVERQAVVGRIDAVLARTEVQEQLKRLGVAPEDAAARVRALSDSELVSLADRLEELPAGGSLLGLAGAVFIVLLILELVGVIDIFKHV
jgi:hypothetical protein